MAQENNHYARLGIPIDATLDEIRRAYREIARKYHPDANLHPGETELFIQAQDAYEVLSDPQKKSSYDQTLSPEPESIVPLQVNIQYSRACLPRISEPQLIYALIDINSNLPGQDEAIPPKNICLILDTSTSMQGEMIETLKATAVEIVRQIGPDDVISIVTFNDRAEVLLPAGSLLDLSRVEMKIRMIQAKGGTEVFKGLESGFHEVRRYCSSNHVNHIILVTDGRTYGDEKNCLTMARQAASLGIAISAFGIGSQWNDLFLDKLTSITGGSCALISKPAEIRSFLHDKVTHLNSRYAEQVAYHYELAPKCELLYAFRIQPDSIALENNSPLMLGYVPRNSSLTVILELLAQELPAQSNQVTLAQGRIHYSIPGNTALKYSTRLELIRTISNDAVAFQTPDAIIKAMSVLILYRMHEQARTDITKGRIREATRRLQNLATHFNAHGNREMARTVLSEIAYIQENQAFSELGEKKIKYGTRSLLLPPGKEEIIS